MRKNSSTRASSKSPSLRIRFFLSLPIVCSARAEAAVNQSQRSNVADAAAAAAAVTRRLKARDPVRRYTTAAGPFETVRH